MLDNEQEMDKEGIFKRVQKCLLHCNCKEMNVLKINECVLFNSYLFSF